MRTVLITGACINTGVAVVEKFAEFAREGLPVWCVGGTPDRTVEGDMIDWEIRSLFRDVTLEDLVNWQKAKADEYVI